MDEGIKQRLVGVLVLVIAALFLVPWVFDQHIVRHVAEQIEIPPRPAPNPSLISEEDLTFIPVEEPEVVRPVEQEINEVDRQYVDPVKGHSLLDSAPLDENGVPIAWALQVASFGKRENAQSLIAKLEAGGYKAYMTDVKKASGGKLIRVFVGPDLQHSKIKLYQSQLESRYKLKGIIVRYRTQ